MSAPEQLNAPLANFMRHNGGWSVTLSFADPVTAISWRFGESGNFRETGHLNTLDPRTRKRMPNPSIQLDADTPEGTIYVRYADARGEWAEPFPVKFDPAGALERSQREILEMTVGQLAVVPGVQRADGLLHASHVVSLRDPRSEDRHRLDGARSQARDAALRSARPRPRSRRARSPT